jgi:hypothetical protein
MGLVMSYGAGMVHAQDAGCALNVGTTALEVGEVADATLVCRNTGEPELPQLTVPEGVSLQAISATPSQRSLTQIVNGQRYAEKTFSFQLRLTALQPGTYRLGPIAVQAGGKTFLTLPVTITARAQKVDNAPRGDRIVFVEIGVEPSSLYLTQSLSAELTLGIRKVQINGREFELDLLRDVLDQRSSQFSVFGDPADRTMTTTGQTILDSTGTPHRYEIFRIKKRIRVDEVGELNIGPVFAKVNYPTQLRRSFWGGFEVAAAATHTARAAAVTVAVKPPPEQGRPPTFAGAIGRYAFDVSAKPTEVELGQPITLSMRIRGAPLEGLAGPYLSVAAGLAGRFDYTADEPIGETEGGARVFRKAVFPRQIGDQTIPPIAWSYFDPRAERYVTLNSEPIPIVVNPSTSSPDFVGIASGGDLSARDRQTKLTILQGGISPNVVNSDRLLGNHAVAFGPAWGATVVAGPIAWFATALLVRHRHRLSKDAGYARRRRAFRRATARIQLARRNEAPKEQMALLASAVTGYVADRFGRPGASLTTEEVGTALSEHKVYDETRRSIEDFLRAADAARYASVSGAPGDFADADRRVRGWLRQLEAHRTS